MDEHYFDEQYIQERIARLRMKKGVSARDMSLSLGQSESYINTIENKKALPSMALFLVICEYFDISPKDFFDADNGDPAIIRAIVKDLKLLNDPALHHIAGIVKELAQKQNEK